MAKSKFRKYRNKRKTKRRRGGDKRFSNGTENAFIGVHTNNKSDFTGTITIEDGGQTYSITITPANDGRLGGFDLEGTKEALDIFKIICDRSQSQKVTFTPDEPTQSRDAAAFENPQRKGNRDPWGK